MAGVREWQWLESRSSEVQIPGWTFFWFSQKWTGPEGHPFVFFRHWATFIEKISDQRLPFFIFRNVFGCYSVFREVWFFVVFSYGKGDSRVSGLPLRLFFGTRILMKILVPLHMKNILLHLNRKRGVDLDHSQLVLTPIDLGVFWNFQKICQENFNHQYLHNYAYQRNELQRFWKVWFWAFILVRWAPVAARPFLQNFCLFPVPPLRGSSALRSNRACSNNRIL